MSKEQQTQAEIKEGLQRRILDLQNEVVALRQEISEQPRVDELHRKNFTMLLGKPEDKILSWAEVYFELGVLTVQAERYEGDELTMCEKEKCNCDRVHF